MALSPLSFATHAQSWIVPPLAPFPFELLTFSSLGFLTFFSLLTSNCEARLSSAQGSCWHLQAKTRVPVEVSAKHLLLIPVGRTVLHGKEPCVPWPPSQDLSTPSVQGHTLHTFPSPSPPNSHPLAGLIPGM